MTSLHDHIEAMKDDFLDTEISFADCLELWPAGDKSLAIEFNGVWDEDSIPGTNETQGDGRVMNRYSGRSDRKSVLIECDVDLPIQDPQPEVGFDVIYYPKIKTQANVKRIIGRDESMMTLFAVMHEHVSKRKGTRTG